jgi:hypothetical protein
LASSSFLLQPAAASARRIHTLALPPASAASPTQPARPQPTWYASPEFPPSGPGTRSEAGSLVACSRAATQVRSSQTTPPVRPCRTSAGRLVALLSLRRVLSLKAMQRNPCEVLDLRSHRSSALCIVNVAALAGSRAVLACPSCPITKPYRPVSFQTLLLA